VTFWTCAVPSTPTRRSSQEFALFLNTAAEEGLQLPGGRYACARALLSKRLPCLQTFSLGQLCHIVQLAINSRRLLGYNREGWLVAYEQSEGWLKQQCACAQASTGQEVHPVVSWEEARMFLRQLLQPHHQAGSGGITLSNLKRLFRVHFERELSETALGHIRLLDLMKDARLSDICALSVQGNGQTTVQAAESSQLCPAIPPGMWTIPVPMCPMPMLTLVPVPVHTDASAPLELLSPGASPRGSPCGGLSFATESTTEGSLDVAFSMPALTSLPVRDVGALEELVSPGSSPRGSLCGAQSFATESTAEGSPDSISESDEAEAMSSPFHLQCDDEVELWSVSVKNTFVDVTMTDCESASPSSRQRRRSTPALSRTRAVY